MEMNPEEEVEVSREEFVVLRYSRVWPDYVVTWIRRRRESHESSFPVATGDIKSRTDPPDWDAMRAQALEAAGAPAQASAGEPAHRPLMGRLFGRR